MTGRDIADAPDFIDVRGETIVDAPRSLEAAVSRMGDATRNIDAAGRHIGGAFLLSGGARGNTANANSNVGATARGIYLGRSW
jgi:hypothetical protein